MVTIILNALMSYHLVMIMLIEAAVALAVLAYFGRPTRSERFLKSTQALDLSPYNKEGPMKTTFTLVLILCLCLAGSAKAAENYDARAALALASATTVAKPQATPCDVADCKCGCADGGVCTCSVKASKKWYATYMYGTDGSRFWVVSQRDYPIESDSVHYGSAEEALDEAIRRNKSLQKYMVGDRKNGYTLDADGYWYKDEPALPTIPAPQYAPVTFPQEALRQGYQPMNFQPMMRMGFSGGGMRGCAGGG